MEYERLPEEFAVPVPESATGAEPSGMPREPGSAPEPRDFTGAEFLGKSGGKEGEKAGHDRSRLIKRLMLQPLTAALATLSIVFASYGADPLGENFLAKGSAVLEDESGENGRGTENGKGGTKSGRNNIEGLTREFPGDLTDAFIHVHYVSEDVSDTMASRGEEGLAEARAWVESLGGDPGSLTYVSHETITRRIAEGPIVGDEDDLEHAYDPFGNVREAEELHVYYEAYASLEELRKALDGEEAREDETSKEFPWLTNRDPDFEGAHAWGDDGSEEFVRFTRHENAKEYYLQMGQYWRVYNEGAYERDESQKGEEYAGNDASYDPRTNVLTLRNFDGDRLEANLMGNGFTIELIGENHVGILQVWGAGYGGSVTFTGDGSLILNERGEYGGAGIILDCEGSESCLMIEPTVTLEVHGGTPILVRGTVMQEAVFMKNPMTMKGGMIVNDQEMAYSEYYGVAVHDVYVVSEEGIVRFVP